MPKLGFYKVLFKAKLGSPLVQSWVTRTILEALHAAKLRSSALQNIFHLWHFFFSGSHTKDTQHGDHGPTVTLRRCFTDFNHLFTEGSPILRVPKKHGPELCEVLPLPHKVITRWDIETWSESDKKMVPMLSRCRRRESVASRDGNMTYATIMKI